MIVKPPALPAQLAQAFDALRRGDRAAVEALCRAQLAVTPSEFRAASLLGAVLTDSGRANEALPFLEHAARHELGARYNLALAHHALGRLEDAAVGFEAVLRESPDWRDARNNLGSVMLDLGFAHRAVDVLRVALNRPGLTPVHFSNLLLAMQYLPEVARDELADLHRAFGNALAAALPKLPKAPARQPGPLRVGFVSGDLRHHPVGLLLEGLLPALRARGWWLAAYSTRPGLDGDPVPARLAASVDHWVDISPLDDPAAAQRVRDDRIDVLFDLSGHTGYNRLGVFQMQPAPLQLSWLGYGGSTGLATVDAVISDAVSTPTGVDGDYTEGLVRLPFPRLPFTPPADAPAVADAPQAAGQAFTFGCFNNIAKLNPQVVDAWAAILKASPGTRLLMKGRQFDHAGPGIALRNGFAARGIDADRILLEGFTRRAGYYPAFHRVDLALDPFPFNGGMSTLDALWMGVPVLSLQGDRMWGRQGAMFLTALGLDDWLTDSVEAYIARAVKAVTEAESLAALRYALRPRVAAAAFARPADFAAGLGDAVEALHRQKVGAA